MITVTKGETPVTVTNNKFTMTEKGNYVVTATFIAPLNDMKLHIVDSVADYDALRKLETTLPVLDVAVTDVVLAANPMLAVSIIRDDSMPSTTHPIIDTDIVIKRNGVTLTHAGTVNGTSGTFANVLPMFINTPLTSPTPTPDHLGQTTKSGTYQMTITYGGVAYTRTIVYENTDETLKTVTFNNKGTDVAKYAEVANATIIAPAAPVSSNPDEVFSHWASGETKVLAGGEITVTADATYNAVYVTAIDTVLATNNTMIRGMNTANMGSNTCALFDYPTVYSEAGITYVPATGTYTIDEADWLAFVADAGANPPTGSTGELTFDALTTGDKLLGIKAEGKADGIACFGVNIKTPTIAGVTISHVSEDIYDTITSVEAFLGTDITGTIEYLGFAHGTNVLASDGERTIRNYWYDGDAINGVIVAVTDTVIKRVVTPATPAQKLATELGANATAKGDTVTVSAPTTFAGDALSVPTGVTLVIAENANLTSDAPITVDGIIEAYKPTQFAGTGTLTFNQSGKLILKMASSSVTYIGGMYTMAEGASIVLKNEAPLQTMTIDGNVTLTAADTITAGNTLSVNANSTLTVNLDATLTMGSGNSKYATLDGAGKVVVNGTFIIPKFEKVLTSKDGNLTITDSGTLKFSSGKKTYIAPSATNDPEASYTTTLGTNILFNNTTGMTIDGDVTLVKNEKIYSSTALNIADGATLTIATGATLTNQGTLNVKGTLNVEGTLTNDGTLTNNGAIYVTLTGELIQLAGSTNDGSGTISGEGDYPTKPS